MNSTDQLSDVAPALDYPQATEALAEQLGREGHPAAQAQLLAALQSGSTATEIVMAVRWQLGAIESAAGLSETSLARVRRLGRELQQLIDDPDGDDESSAEDEP